MYGIFTYIWLKFMVNVYRQKFIHGAFGKLKGQGPDTLDFAKSFTLDLAETPQGTNKWENHQFTPSHNVSAPGKPSIVSKQKCSCLVVNR